MAAQAAGFLADVERPGAAELALVAGEKEQDGEPDQHQHEAGGKERYRRAGWQRCVVGADRASQPDGDIARRFGGLRLVGRRVVVDAAAEKPDADLPPLAPPHAAAVRGRLVEDEREYVRQFAGLRRREPGAILRDVPQHAADRFGAVVDVDPRRTPGPYAPPPSFFALGHASEILRRP